MRCCSWGVRFSAAASSEKDHGSMNLALNTAPLSSTRLRVAPTQRWPDAKCASVDEAALLRLLRE
jgi:hypothetical protein